MHYSEFDHTYLLATSPAGDGGVDILDVAPVDGTGFCRPVDYHSPEALTLRMTREQAHHLYRSLGHTLGLSATT